MIKITTDSTCDLPAELLEQHNITVLPLGIVKAGKLYQDGINIRTADIAAHVDAGGEITTTNAVNAADYETVFRQETERYDAVIHINIGMGFSCCHQNAMLAAEEVPEVYVWWTPATSAWATAWWCWRRRRPLKPASPWRRSWPCWRI